VVLPVQGEEQEDERHVRFDTGRNRTRMLPQSHAGRTVEQTLKFAEETRDIPPSEFYRQHRGAEAYVRGTGVTVPGRDVTLGLLSALRTAMETCPVAKRSELRTLMVALRNVQRRDLDLAWSPELMAVRHDLPTIVEATDNLRAVLHRDASRGTIAQRLAHHRMSTLARDLLAQDQRLVRKLAIGETRRLIGVLKARIAAPGTDASLRVGLASLRAQLKVVRAHGLEANWTPTAVFRRAQVAPLDEVTLNLARVIRTKRAGAGAERIQPAAESGTQQLILELEGRIGRADAAPGAMVEPLSLLAELKDVRRRQLDQSWSYAPPKPGRALPSTASVTDNLRDVKRRLASKRSMVHKFAYGADVRRAGAEAADAARKLRKAADQAERLLQRKASSGAKKAGTGTAAKTVTFDESINQMYDIDQEEPASVKLAPSGKRRSSKGETLGGSNIRTRGEKRVALGARTHLLAGRASQRRG
jgi:hypothetical protein